EALRERGVVQMTARSRAMSSRFVLPLPTVVLHPLTAVAIALLHVYLSIEHLSKLFGGDVTWTDVWKGLGALGAVVGREDDDGVVELAHRLELGEHKADVVVHMLHAGFIHAPVLAAARADHGHVLIRQHSGDVHARRVVPDEERLVGLPRVVAIEEVHD